MGVSQSLEVCQTCCKVFSRLVQMQRTWIFTDYFNRKSERLLFFDGSGSLEKSARSCPSCELILRMIQSSLPITDGLFVMALERSMYRDGTYRVQLTTGASLLNFRIVGFLDCFANPESQAAISGDIIARQDNLFTDIDNYKICVSWIKDCFENHSTCSQNHGPGGPQEPIFCSTHALVRVPPPDMKPNLPPRVLDIGPPWSNEYIGLIETNGEKFHYVALTYIWGKVRVYKTTAENIQAHKLGILTRRLNRTFTDAIDVVKKLGFRYLWIDALCIIQGSNDDWERHARIMSDIYANATLTISASGATSANSTLMPEQRHLTFVKMPYQTREGALDGKYFLRWPAEGISSQAVDGELSKRGWCLQERILSRRILHMGAFEMGWECRSRFRRENDFIWDSSRKDLWDGGGEEDSPERDFQPWEGANLFKGLHLGEIFSTGATSVAELEELIDFEDQRRFTGGSAPASARITGQVYDAWYRMVQEYSRRETTVESDRLPAIAGVAQKFAAIIHDRYVGGLWANDIAIGLLWERGRIMAAVDRGFTPSAIDLVLKTPKVKRGPSWSWLALDGPKCFASLIKNHFPRARNNANISNFAFAEDKSYGNSTSTVENTMLTFSGVVDTLQELTGWKATEANIQKDDFTISFNDGPEINGRIVLDAPENDPLEALHDTLYLLPVNLTMPYVEGLLLHYVGPNNTFRRVGIGAFNHPAVFVASGHRPSRSITLI